MRDVRYPPVLILLLFVACLIVGCGSSNRQLQSLTIHADGDCCETIFTAAGAYNAAPFTMTPVPTSWSLGTPPDTYELTTHPFTVICPPPEASYVVTAMSPVNPNAPSSGLVSNTKMIVNTTQAVCQ